MLYKILFLLLIIVIIIYLINNNKDLDDNENMSLLKTNRNSLNQKNSKLNLPINKEKEKRKLTEMNQDYTELLERSQDDLVYFQNDFINQSKITENAYDVENCIDKVDYGNITTGMDKCQQSCSGVCVELGYTGVASCFPKADKPFDWGTLYKNPEFTYGLTQDGQEPYFKGNFNYEF
jgi:hypothetical protein